MISVFDIEDFKNRKNNPKIIKIPSGEITNTHFRILRKKSLTLLSTGMSTLKEIKLQ